MAVGDKISLDTDVALDHLADRQPFAEYAHRLFALAETGEITLCLSALSFSNLYYRAPAWPNSQWPINLK
jgi:hypothetical protein